MKYDREFYNDMLSENIKHVMEEVCSSYEGKDQEKFNFSTFKICKDGKVISERSISDSKYESLVFGMHELYLDRHGTMYNIERMLDGIMTPMEDSDVREYIKENFNQLADNLITDDQLSEMNWKARFGGEE